VPKTPDPPVEKYLLGERRNDTSMISVSYLFFMTSAKKNMGGMGNTLLHCRKVWILDPDLDGIRWGRFLGSGSGKLPVD
jgi:hypothetical protein